MSDLIIPLAQAEYINSDDLIEGILLPKLKRFKELSNSKEIKLETLKYSFDGGITWITPSALKEVLEECKEFARITTRLEELQKGT